MSRDSCCVPLREGLGCARAVRGHCALAGPQTAIGGPPRGPHWAGPLRDEEPLGHPVHSVSVLPSLPRPR